MYYLGVDLGGYSISAGVVDESGAIIYKDKTPTFPERGNDEILKDIAILSKDMLGALNLCEEDIVSMGIGCPGSVDKEKGIIIFAPNIGFKHVHIREFLKGYFSFPVYIDNDANCAALGESISGAGAGFKSSVTVTIGTGLGGGIIIDGKIYSGAYGSAGEIGHHVIEVNGRPCGCGRLGCFEAYASAQALVKEARKALSVNKESIIYDLCGKNTDNMNAKIIFEAYNLKDGIAVGLVEEYMNYLAEGLSNIINILQPEAVIIGGGVGEAGESLLHPLKALIDKKVYGKMTGINILNALLGNDAGIIGAAMLNS